MYGKGMIIVKKTDKCRKSIWIPRILAILFILFLIVFSFDVFEGEASLFEKLGGFLIHSIPSLVMLAALIALRSYPIACGTVFIVIGIIFTLFFNTYTGLAKFLAISFPPVIIGALFIIFSLKRNKQV